jgi:hypothetical protein
MSIKNTTLSTVLSEVDTGTGDRAITVIYLYNKSGSSVTFNIHAVPSGGTAGEDNTIYGSKTLTANETYIIETEKILLDSGDTIFANASANSAVIVTTSYASI